MRPTRSLPLAVTCLLAFGACRTTYKAETTAGPGQAPANPTVVMFPVPCHSSDDKCEDSYGDAVTALIQSELEFVGYRVLDGEKLVRTARTREDSESSLSVYRDKVLAAKSRRQVGSIFEDLPPRERAELLAEAQADGLITAVIKMLPRGSSDNWLVEVQVRFGLSNGDLVWVTRCKHESYWNERDSWSIEEAAKCALKGALAKGSRPGNVAQVAN